MIDFWVNTRIPTWIRLRRWWLPVLALWAAAVGISLNRHLDDLRRQSLEVASEGARNLFSMVVLTRAWNAGHGGVYVPVSDKAQPNPWLVHPRRDLETRDGLKLTMINPAYMTRQIGELALESKGTRFHITSLRPIRPDNRADDWERLALAAFEKGVKEVVELRPAGRGSELRYMAPLRVKPPCMKCHAVQGYRVGDVRGGISVSLPFDPILAASAHAREQTWKTHLAVFVLVALAAWGLLELLRRRWHDLADNMVALQTTGNALRSANAELARSRDQAEAASRSKSAFLNAMSHELRTPLNGILGFAHLLQRSELPDKPSEQVRRIAEQGARLLELVNQVVEFTRLEGLDGVTAPGMVEPAAALADLADELRRKAAAKGLAVRVELAAGLPGRVAGNLADLRGCLRPLLDNAVKFTDHGEVSLEARLEAGEGGGSSPAGQRRRQRHRHRRNRPRQTVRALPPAGREPFTPPWRPRSRSCPGGPACRPARGAAGPGQQARRRQPFHPGLAAAPGCPPRRERRRRGGSGCPAGSPGTTAGGRRYGRHRPLA